MTMLPSDPVARTCCGGARSVKEPLPPVDGTFRLVNHFGFEVSERDFGDRFLLLFFGFVHCQVICPRELAKLMRSLELLGPESQRIQPLFVTLDPDRDSPQALRSHLGSHASRFLGLTGSASAIEETRKRFRVFSKKVVDPLASGGYVVPHTAFAYLLKPGGGYMAHFSDTLSADELAHRLRTLMD